MIQNEILEAYRCARNGDRTLGDRRPQPHPRDAEKSVLKETPAAGGTRAHLKHGIKPATVNKPALPL